MVLYKGYCRSLNQKVDFNVEDVISMQTTRGVKWRVKGNYESHNISTFCSETVAQELLSKLPLTMDAEIAYTPPSETYQSEELLPSFSNVTKNYSKGQEANRAEENPIEVHEQIQENTNAQELDLHSEKLPSKYYNKDGSLDMRYTICKELAAKQAESQNAAELEAPYTPLEPERPSDDSGGRGKNRRKPRRPLGAESFDAECKHENWERGETIEPHYIYENGELVDEVNLYWVECNECGAIGDEFVEGGEPTRIKWDAEDKCECGGKILEIQRCVRCGAMADEECPCSDIDITLSCVLCGELFDAESFEADGIDALRTKMKILKDELDERKNDLQDKHDSDIATYGKALGDKKLRDRIKATEKKILKIQATIDAKFKLSYRDNKVLKGVRSNDSTGNTASENTYRFDHRYMGSARQRRLFRRRAEESFDALGDMEFECSSCKVRLDPHMNENEIKNYFIKGCSECGANSWRLVPPQMEEQLRKGELVTHFWDEDSKEWVEADMPESKEESKFDAESFEADEIKIYDPKFKGQDICVECGSSEIPLSEMDGGEIGLSDYYFSCAECDFSWYVAVRTDEHEDGSSAGIEFVGFMDEDGNVSWEPQEFNIKGEPNPAYKKLKAESFEADDCEGCGLPDDGKCDCTIDLEYCTTCDEDVGSKNLRKCNCGGAVCKDCNYCEMCGNNLDAESFEAEDDYNCMVCGGVSEKEMTQDDELCDPCLKTHGRCGVCQDIELLTDLHYDSTGMMKLCGRCEKHDETFEADDTKEDSLKYSYGGFQSEEVSHEANEVVYAEGIPKLQDAEAGIEIEDIEKEYIKKENQFMSLLVDDATLYRIMTDLPDIVEIGFSELAGYTKLRFNYVENPDMEREILQYAIILEDNSEDTNQEPEYRAGDVRNRLFNVEFDDWAEQEMLTHGKEVSFNEWADEESESHGDDELLDWAKHEDESHDERYDAEDFTMSDSYRYELGDEIIALSSTLKRTGNWDWKNLKKIGKAIKQGDFNRLKGHMDDIDIKTRRVLWNEYHEGLLQLFSNKQLHALAIPWVTDGYGAEGGDESFNAEIGNTELKNVINKFHKTIDSYTKGYKYTKCSSCEAETKIDSLEDEDGKILYYFYSCKCGHNDIKDSSYGAESFNSPAREDWLYYCKSCGAQNSLPTKCHACGSNEVKVVIMSGEEESFENYQLLAEEAGGVFLIENNKGFNIEFENGYQVSVKFGAGHYSDNYEKSPIIEMGRYLESSTAEVAILRNGFLIPLDEEGNKKVKGWVPTSIIPPLLTAASEGDEEKIRSIIKEYEKSQQMAEEELGKDSCCCGATVENPCLCMEEGVMNCSAVEPKCPCYAAKDAESFAAEGKGNKQKNSNHRELIAFYEDLEHLVYNTQFEGDYEDTLYYKIFEDDDEEEMKERGFEEGNGVFYIQQYLEIVKKLAPTLYTKVISKYNKNQILKAINDLDINNNFCEYCGGDIDLDEEDNYYGYFVTGSQSPNSLGRGVSRFNEISEDTQWVYYGYCCEYCEEDYLQVMGTNELDWLVGEEVTYSIIPKEEVEKSYEWQESFEADEFPTNEAILEYLKNSHRTIVKYHAPYKYSTNGIARAFDVSKSWMRHKLRELRLAGLIDSVARRTEDAPKGENLKSKKDIFKLADKNIKHDKWVAEESDKFIGKIPTKATMGEKTRIHKNNIKYIFEKVKRPLYPREVMRLYDDERGLTSRKSSYQKGGISSRQISRIVKSPSSKYYISRSGLIHYIGEDSMKDYIRNLDPKYFAEERTYKVSDETILNYLSDSHNQITKYTAPYKYTSWGLAQKFGVHPSWMRALLRKLVSEGKLKVTKRMCEDRPDIKTKTTKLNIYYLADKKMLKEKNAAENYTPFKKNSLDSF